MKIQATRPPLLTTPTDRFTPSQLPEPILDRFERSAARAEEIEAGLGPRTPGQLLVKAPPGTSFEELAADYGATVAQVFTIPEVMRESFAGELAVLELPTAFSEAQVMAAMELDSRVLMSATNDDLELHERLPDDLHPEQWSLKNNGSLGGREGADISAGLAWTITTGSRDNGPVVAVLDSGFDIYHPDLRNNLWTNPAETENRQDDDRNGIVDDVHGVNTLADNGNLSDIVGHGTHVAGIIAAEGNNGQGVTGVNWEGRLMGVKIANHERVSLVGAVFGILYASEKGARISNNSWGGRVYNPVLEDVMRASPMLHVCSAGNAGSDNDVLPSYPASFDLDNIVAVGATARRDDPLNFSNFGATSVDVHAPGAMVYSTLPGNRYDELSGTSMAAPHVTGTAALIATAYPSITNQELKDRLLYSSDPIDALKGKSVSGGRLNAFRALENDRLAPAAVTDFRTLEVAADGVTLAWTGTGDDGYCGTVARYVVKRSEGGAVTPMTADFPGPAGTQESLRFQTFPRHYERALSFSLEAVDNVGNRPVVSRVETVLPAGHTAFFDDLESGQDNWTVEGPWARVPVEGRGMVFTDSPDGDFENGRQDAITSGPIDLAGLRSCVLTFDARTSMEVNFDNVHVEVTEAGKDDWEWLGRLTGESDWSERVFDLSAFDGKEVQVRFQLRTSTGTPGDGVYLDNIRVVGARGTS